MHKEKRSSDLQTPGAIMATASDLRADQANTPYRLPGDLLRPEVSQNSFWTLDYKFLEGKSVFLATWSHGDTSWEVHSQLLN